MKFQSVMNAGNIFVFKTLTLDSFIIDEINRSLSIFGREQCKYFYSILGLHFPEAIIRVTDFFIHTIKFWKLQNSTYNVTRDTIKISQKSQTEQGCLAHGRRSDTTLQIMSQIFFTWCTHLHMSIFPSVRPSISLSVCL